MLALNIVWWENFWRQNALQIGRWQRFCKKTFAVRRSKSYVHTGCMLTTPTSHVKVQWWRVSLVLKWWCVDTTFMKLSGSTIGEELPHQREPGNRHRHRATAWRSSPGHFPSPTDSSCTLFIPALAKTMENDSTCIDREPVGSGSLGSLSTLLKYIHCHCTNTH